MVARGWLGTDLNGLRPDKGTYGFYPMETLPPLDGISLDGSLDWLLPLEPELEASQALHRPDAARRAELARRLQALLAEAAARRIALPLLFERLLGTPELQDRFPSSTACSFDLPLAIAAAPLPLPGGHLVRFLNDQQGCCFWYLWIQPDGRDAVVASAQRLDAGAPREGKIDLVQCADGLEEFLLRYWLENTLFFALNSETTLKEAHGRYARHYRK